MSQIAPDGTGTAESPGEKTPGLHASSMPGLTGFDHVGITVPDIDEATRFLVGVMGCEHLYTLGPLQDHEGLWMTEHLDVHPRAVARSIRFFRCGGSPVLEVFEYSSPDQVMRGPRNSDVGGHHVAFYVEDIDTAVQHLEDHGIQVMGSPTSSVGPHSGQRWVYFIAPWGGQFELVSYPNGRRWYLEHDSRATSSASAPPADLGSDSTGTTESPTHSHPR